MSLLYCHCGMFVSTPAPVTTCPQCLRELRHMHKIDPNQLVDVYPILHQRIHTLPPPSQVIPLIEAIAGCEGARHA